MGYDLRIIMGHELTPSQIIKFPDFLNNCQELKDVYISEFQSKLDHRYTKDKFLEVILKKCEWDWERGGISEANIIKVWKNNCSPTLVEENGYWKISLSTYFGMIDFDERTINILFYPEHKYANIFYESHRKFILRFSRAMAKQLGQSKIVFTGESYKDFDFEDKATEGKSIEEIINYGTLKFGNVPITLKEAITRKYFFEDLNSPLIDFEGNI
jgi:6-pyruvoyl-tetrahydropterin synthase